MKRLSLFCSLLVLLTSFSTFGVAKPEAATLTPSEAVTPAPTLTPGPNLLPMDYGFEDGEVGSPAEGWFPPAPTGAPIVVNTEKHAGNNAGKLPEKGCNLQYRIDEPLEPNTTYNMSTWIKTEADGDVRFDLFYKSSGDYVWQSITNSTRTNGWVKLEKEFTTPSSLEKLDEFYLDKSDCFYGVQFTTYVDIAYIDDLSLVRISGPSPTPEILGPPTIEQVNDSDKKIVVQSDQGTTVKLNIQNHSYIPKKVSVGTFVLKLHKPYKAGTRITAFSVKGDMQSEPVLAFVKPADPKVVAPPAGSIYIYGSAKKGTTIFVYYNNKRYQTTAKTGAVFSVRVPSLKKGKIIKVRAYAGKQYSGYVNVKVKAKEIK